MNPIPRQDKGRLRWDTDGGLWCWLDTGPFLSVVTLASGAFKVNRVRV